MADNSSRHIYDQLGDSPLEVESDLQRDDQSSDAGGSSNGQLDDSTPEEDGANSNSTKSLSDHVIQVVEENGRRYCNDTYFMPNDETEQIRLSITHQIYLMLLEGQLTKIPLPSSTSRILDIGSGTGDWAMAMGEDYPAAEIIATDISVLDSRAISIGPPNVYFQIDDAEGEWTYTEPFDFIHVRGLGGAIASWSDFYRQVYHHLKPGGILQIADTDFTANSLNLSNSAPNSYLSILTAAVHSASEVSGYPRNLNHLALATLTEAGFVDVRTFDIQAPIGTWPEDPRDKTLGKMALIVLLEGIEASSMRLLTKYIGWSADEVIDLCEKVKAELVSNDGMTGSVRLVVAKKPL
ncbi:hypothetical protein FQN57_005284 [Myotisia sp. PD_48]|nr:hypothetical protein FQN57_005284 [Myotisia sp. PD_48]